LKLKPLQIISIILIVTLSAIGFSSCSTKRNTASARAYHNLTAHYNVYWNGMYNLQEGITYLQKNRKDNYDHVLRLYNYGDKELGKQLKSKMTRSLKKASLSIQHHSMVFNGKEQIRWVTESYLLMGKAYFYSQEYVAARRVFDFVAKKYLWLPIHYKGMLWLAKTAIEAGNPGKAEAMLNLLTSQKGTPNFPPELKNKLIMVQADFYLAKNNLTAAYPFLEKSLKICKDRDLRSRIMFIMGQINQKEGHLEKATALYQKVIKLNPPFQMAFEARLNMAMSYDSVSGNKKQIVNTLEKMARKNQYQEYLDQIYFALAGIAEKNHQDSTMVKDLMFSVSHAKNNNYQKSASSLKLADFLFESGRYITAQAYYDTAVQSLPKDYPDYDEIKRKTAVLSKMVKDLQTIHVQDSLQQLARMDTADLYVFIDKKIALYKKQMASKKEAEEIAKANKMSNVPVQNMGNSQGFSSGNRGWYFYNTAAKSRGYSEFIQRWGDRKLEDLWFISDKQMQENGGQQTIGKSETVNAGKANGKQEKDLTSRAFYLKGLPKTASDFHASDSLIMTSYYRLGDLYLEDLQDSIHALEIFTRLDKRFPMNPFRLENWYHLYKMNADLRKDSLASLYKEKILDNYPNSLYAHVISDPNYYKKLQKTRLATEKLYGRTFSAFQNQQYYRVLSYARMARIQLDGDTTLLPRFMYLEALAMGKVDVPDSLYSYLQRFIKKYPHHPLSDRSKAIIKMLQKEYGIGISKQEQEALQEKSKDTISSGPYAFDKNAPQFVMILVDRKSVQTRSLITRLGDFNHKHFVQRQLTVDKLALNKQYQLVIVGKLSIPEAQVYFKALKKDAYVFSGIDSKEYQLYIISVKNFPLFYRDKNIKGYQTFFHKYYQ